MTHIPAHQDIIDISKGYETASGTEEWSFGKGLEWVLEYGTSNMYIESFKDQLVAGYSSAILAAANKYDIPPLLLAGVLHIEGGGDPPIWDDLAYFARNFETLRNLGEAGILPSFFAPQKDMTSFGNTSVQVRTAAITLGYDYDSLTQVQKDDIIQTLKDPVQAIFVSALHLSQLRDYDYPLTAGNELTEEQIVVIASRYNRGKSETKEEIVNDYGNRILDMKLKLEMLLGIGEERSGGRSSGGGGGRR
jgi:hypothetical protein